jgi:hypothetical protein
VKRKLLSAVCVIAIPCLTTIGFAQAAPVHQPPDYLEIDGSHLRIQVGANGSVQVFHRDYAQGAAYGPGASGAFIAVGQDVYGPAMAAGPFFNPLTPVSNRGPTGAGTAGDPFRIVTTQRLEGSGAALDVVQTVSYVNDEEHFRLDWQITSRGDAQTCFKLYHAADLFFADDDRGRGYYDADSGAVGGFNQDRDWFMVFVPLTPADHYGEAFYSSIWADVSSARDLDDGVDDGYVDNGVALQWDRCLGAGESVTISDRWSFGTSERDAVGGQPRGGPIDVWVRDSPEDDGSVPSTENNAAWWTSPDIWVRNQQDGEDQHQNPIEDRENSVYVLVRNRGTETARDVRVNLYYADANLLAPFWPDSFTFFGETIVDEVAAGGTARAEPVAWVPPDSGHLCLLVRLESEEDPIRVEGDVPGDNNIAQRNVHAVTLLAEARGEPGDASVEPVVVAPSDGQDHAVDLVIQYPGRPASLIIRIILPSDLFERWRDGGGTLSGGEIEGDAIRATAPNETVIGGLPLESGEEAPFRVEFEGTAGATFAVGVVERLDGEDVGGNVYVYDGLLPTPPAGGDEPQFPFGCCPLGAVILVLGVALWIRRGS